MDDSELLNIVQKELDYYKERVTLKCPICLEVLGDDSITILCNHQFHKECLQSWKNTETINGQCCPVCRASLDGKKKKKSKLPEIIDTYEYECIIM